jgi:hypothetical protein
MFDVKIVMVRYLFDVKVVKVSQYLLNLGLSLKSMKRILTNYGTDYLSNGNVSHGVSVSLMVREMVANCLPFLLVGLWKS